MKIDLNAPAFGKGAQSPTESGDEVVPAVEPVVEPAKIEPEVTTTVVESDEDTKVPYSRFKKFHDAAKVAEEERDYWKQQAELLKEGQHTTTTTVTDDLPSQWVKLYGDSDASKEAWEVQKQLNAQILEQARQEARESLRDERTAELEREEGNLNRIDEGFDELTDIVGRKLSEAEQSAVLDIIDDYTPKDRNGDYAGEILPFDKAWEIYELKNQVSKVARNTSRDNVAALTGGTTKGDSSVKAEQEKNWNPFDWNAYKNRI